MVLWLVKRVYFVGLTWYITVDDIKNEISFDGPVANRNGKKVGLILAYVVFSFYNVENDEKIHFKNHSETIKVKSGCYTMKDIEKVSLRKLKLNMTLLLVNQ